MGRPSSTSTASRRGCGFHPASILVVLICLLASPRPVAAVGGWETIHILMGRLSGQRAQSDEPNQGRKSPEERIAPVPNGGAGEDKKQEEGGAGKKKKHVGEVTMTSQKRTSPAQSSLPEEGTGPAFVPRGRRGLNLDENDLRTITFVGRSNPFL